MTLEVSSLFKQDESKIENIDSPINIIDISKGGIGFESESDMPEGYYFNACLQLGEDEDARLYCVVKIIRKTAIEKGFRYGSELVGFAPILSYIFEDYEKSLRK